MAFTESTSTPSIVWGALFGTVAVLVEASSVVHWLLLAGIAVVPPVLARMLCRAYAVRPLFAVHGARR